MDLKYLKQFYELAQFIEKVENPKLSNFAFESGFSLNHITQIVSELEKELGCQLLIGDENTTIQLTKEAQIAVQRIPFILAELELAKDLINSTPNLDEA
jgi:DNA-binding transcriptional LysR family regulator